MKQMVDRNEKAYYDFYIQPSHFLAKETPAVKVMHPKVKIPKAAKTASKVEDALILQEAWAVTRCIVSIKFKSGAT